MTLQILTEFIGLSWSVGDFAEEDAGFDGAAVVEVKFETAGENGGWADSLPPFAFAHGEIEDACGGNGDADYAQGKKYVAFYSVACHICGFYLIRRHFYEKISQPAEFFWDL